MIECFFRVTTSSPAFHLYIDKGDTPDLEQEKGEGDQAEQKKG